jgi:hypothetical protein
MAHDHHHEHNGAYFLEQLWTIGTCGALGVVMILLWWYGVLSIFLDSKFHDPVLWGGIALLVLVGVRVAALWPEVARRRAHAHSHAEDDHGHDHGHDHDHRHDHDHGHDHGHDHDHAHDHGHDHHEHTHAHDADELAIRAELAEHGHDHGDDHGHEHGWAPWRYAVLLLPVVLFLMHLPWPQAEEPVEKDVMAVKLTEAEQSAETPQSREYWKQQMTKYSVRLKGKCETPWTDEHLLGLVRLKMTCCFADAYGEPVKIMIRSQKPLDQAKIKGKWVKVIGKMDYMPTKDGYVTVVKEATVKPISTPANQFDN